MYDRAVYHLSRVIFNDEYNCFLHEMETDSLLMVLGQNQLLCLFGSRRRCGLFGYGLLHSCLLRRI